MRNGVVFATGVAYLVLLLDHESNHCDVYVVKWHYLLRG